MQFSDNETKEPPKPSLTQLPNLKVVHFYDPDTGDEILTREDLVVVVTCEEQHSKLVQHAEGTHIYSEVWEYFPSHPVEVVASRQHIYDWPTSCPKGKEFMREGGGILENQNAPINDCANNINIVEVKDNIENSVRNNKMDEMHVNSMVVRKFHDSKKKNDMSYEKKQPIQGLLAELPNKIGVELNDFAEAQKKHSQTWAPKGFGEVHGETPNWVWPPQPPRHCQERYSTSPQEELTEFIKDPKSKKPLFSIVWHVRKDGSPKVHGKVKQYTNF